MSVQHDKISRIVRVQWEDDDSTYLALGFRVRLWPTLDFQQPLLIRQAQDWARDPLPEAPAYTGQTGWEFYVTNSRYMWAPNFIRLSNYSNPILGGTGWAVCVDDLSEGPVSVMAGYDLESGEWDDLFVFDQETFSGIPAINETIYTAPALTVAAAVGSGSTQFWPEPEWQTISGGSPIIPEGGTGPIMAPTDEDQEPIAFTTTLSADLITRGISGSPIDEQINGFRAMECEGDAIGFVPEGGPVVIPNMQATAEFASTSIDFSGVTIEVADEDGTRNWEAVGAAHVPAVFNEEVAFKRPSGTLWVLMAAV